MNSVKFKCQKLDCPNMPIKIYKYKNKFFYICSRHLLEFESKYLPKLIKGKNNK